jgi:hypothetical protein
MRMAQFVPSYAVFGVVTGIALVIALGGCSLQMPKAPEAAISASRPADQLVGKSLDTLIAQLGQPTRSSQADNGQTSVVWQFEPRETLPPTGAGGLYGDGNSPAYVSQGYSPFCRITAVVSTADGNVIQASTEESNGTGAPGRGGNICSRYLRAKSLT